LEERLGQPVQAVAVLGEELHGIFVRLPHDPMHLVVDALPRALGDLRVA
jgi:hypothetical protein